VLNGTLCEQLGQVRWFQLAAVTAELQIAAVAWPACIMLAWPGQLQLLVRWTLEPGCSQAVAHVAAALQDIHACY
jgi:hypothetical protein